VPPHEQASQQVTATARAVAPSAPGVVEWSRTVRRLRRSLSTIAVLVVAGWLVLGALAGALDVRLLAELAGLGLLASFLVEVVVVGGGAVRGMLQAGERGERLSGGDVSLLPPQVTRRRRS
jgi:uncharacterized membrane protein YraQ (UPF0718 family)